MLPKQFRLSGNQIPHILKKGKRARTDTATLIVVPREHKSDHTRLTVIVPYRLSKKAVQRNRAKRLIREAIHTRIDQLISGFDGIIMANTIMKDKKLADIQPSINALLKKGNLILTPSDNPHIVTKN